MGLPPVQLTWSTKPGADPTYLDSTATSCWPTDPARNITMPWCVATAINFEATLDYESATHIGAT